MIECQLVGQLFPYSCRFDEIVSSVAIILYVLFQLVSFYEMVLSIAIILYRTNDIIVRGAVKIASTPTCSLDVQYHTDFQGGG